MEQSQQRLHGIGSPIANAPQHGFDFQERSAAPLEPQKQFQQGSINAPGHRIHRPEDPIVPAAQYATSEKQLDRTTEVAVPQHRLHREEDPIVPAVKPSTADSGAYLDEDKKKQGIVGKLFSMLDNLVHGDKDERYAEQQQQQQRQQQHEYQQREHEQQQYRQEQEQYDRYAEHQRKVQREQQQLSERREYDQQYEQQRFEQQQRLQQQQQLQRREFEQQQFQQQSFSSSQQARTESSRDAAVQGPQAASVALRPDVSASDSFANIGRSRRDADGDGIPDSQERSAAKAYNPAMPTTQHTGVTSSFAQPLAPGMARTSGFSMDPPASQGSYTAQAAAISEPVLQPPTLVLPVQPGQAPMMVPQNGQQLNQFQSGQQQLQHPPQPFTDRDLSQGQMHLHHVPAPTEKHVADMVGTELLPSAGSGIFVASAPRDQSQQHFDRQPIQQQFQSSQQFQPAPQQLQQQQPQRVDDIALSQGHMDLRHVPAPTEKHVADMVGTELIPTAGSGVFLSSAPREQSGLNDQSSQFLPMQQQLPSRGHSSDDVSHIAQQSLDAAKRAPAERHYNVYPQVGEQWQEKSIRPEYPRAPAPSLASSEYSSLPQRAEERSVPAAPPVPWTGEQLHREIGESAPAITKSDLQHGRQDLGLPSVESLSLRDQARPQQQFEQLPQAGQPVPPAQAWFQPVCPPFGINDKELQKAHQDLHHVPEPQERHLLNQQFNDSVSGIQRSAAQQTQQWTRPSKPAFDITPSELQAGRAGLRHVAEPRIKTINEMPGLDQGDWGSEPIPASVAWFVPLYPPYGLSDKALQKAHQGLHHVEQPREHHLVGQQLQQQPQPQQQFVQRQLPQQQMQRPKWDDASLSQGQQHLRHVPAPVEKHLTDMIGTELLPTGTASMMNPSASHVTRGASVPVQSMVLPEQTHQFISERPHRPYEHIASTMAHNAVASALPPQQQFVPSDRISQSQPQFSRNEPLSGADASIPIPANSTTLAKPLSNAEPGVPSDKYVPPGTYSSLFDPTAPVGPQNLYRPPVSIGHTALPAATISQPAAAITQPIMSQPIAPQPVMSQPIAPVAQQPMMTQPIMSQPIVSQPIIPQPATRDADIVRMLPPLVTPQDSSSVDDEEEKKKKGGFLSNLFKGKKHKDDDDHDKTHAAQSSTHGSSAPVLGPQAASVALRPDVSASDSFANIGRSRRDADGDGIPDSQERSAAQAYNPAMPTTQHTGVTSSFAQPLAPGMARTSGFSMDPPASQGSYTAQAAAIGEPVLQPPTLIMPTQPGQAPMMVPGGAAMSQPMSQPLSQPLPQPLPAHVEPLHASSGAFQPSGPISRPEPEPIRQPGYNYLHETTPARPQNIPAQQPPQQPGQHSVVRLPNGNVWL